MRPTAVRQAEWVFIGAIALTIATAAMMWRDIAATYGPVFSAGVTAFSVGFWLLLLLLATRRGANWARWGLVVLTGFGIVSILQQIATGQVALGTPGVLNAVQVGLTVVGAVLLFRPAAKAWFARPHTEWEDDA